MVENSRDFAVDIDELDLLVSRANGFIGFLTESLDGLSHRIATLQQNWQGVAATALEEAYREWAIGAAEVVDESLRCTPPPSPLATPTARQRKSISE